MYHITYIKNGFHRQITISASCYGEAYRIAEQGAHPKETIIVRGI